MDADESEAAVDADDAEAAVDAEEEEAAVDPTMSNLRRGGCLAWMPRMPFHVEKWRPGHLGKRVPVQGRPKTRTPENCLLRVKRIPKHGCR